MILLANFLYAVGSVLSSLIFLFIIVFVARAILSWVSPDPYNPIVRFLYNITEPILAKVRPRIPPLGMLDLSVLVVILALYFINLFLVQSMLDYAQVLKHGSTLVRP